MGIQDRDDELFEDIEELITTSFQESKSKDDEDVFDYLCKSIAKTDSYDAIRAQADKGDAKACLQVASWHIANAENIRDYCTAYKYASKAKREGYIEAYYILGQLELYGTGCSKNIPRAIKHLLYFVENMEQKDLPNEMVLADAYAKLGEAYAIRDLRKEAYYYYSCAQEIDKRFDTQLVLLRGELEDKQRGYFFAAVVLATLFLCICGLVFVYVNYFSGQYELAGFFQKDAVEQTIDRE